MVGIWQSLWINGFTPWRKGQQGNITTVVQPCDNRYILKLAEILLSSTVIVELKLGFAWLCSAFFLPNIYSGHKQYRMLNNTEKYSIKHSGPL
jgi:hypothetical protein